MVCDGGERAMYLHVFPKGCEPVRAYDLFGFIGQFPTA